MDDEKKLTQDRTMTNTAVIGEESETFDMCVLSAARKVPEGYVPVYLQLTQENMHKCHNKVIKTPDQENSLTLQS